MGERTNGMSADENGRGGSKRISVEISTLREEIGDLVDELDRRRRDAFDVRLQLQRHPVAASVAGVVIAAALGGTVAALVYGARRRRRTTYKAKQLRIALQRMMRYPERVARGEPPPSEKILAAIGTAAATLLVRRALERAVPRPRQRAQAAATTASA